MKKRRGVIIVVTFMILVYSAFFMLFVKDFGESEKILFTVIYWLFMVWVFWLSLGKHNEDGLEQLRKVHDFINTDKTDANKPIFVMKIELRGASLLLFTFILMSLFVIGGTLVLIRQVVSGNVQSDIYIIIVIIIFFLLADIKILSDINTRKVEVYKNKIVLYPFFPPFKKVEIDLTKEFKYIFVALPAPCLPLPDEYFIIQQNGKRIKLNNFLTYWNEFFDFLDKMYGNHYFGPDRLVPSYPPGFKDSGVIKPGEVKSDAQLRTEAEEYGKIKFNRNVALLIYTPIVLMLLLLIFALLGWFRR